MAQSTDLVVPNTSAAGVRSGINTRLQAIATHQSGATAPATTYPYQFWADTSAGLLKQRNGANTAWVTVGQLNVENLGLATTANVTTAITTATANALPVLLTAKNCQSSSVVEFSEIPSWVKRVTLMFDQVSVATNSISTLVQLGTDSGWQTSGYSSGSVRTANAGSTAYNTSSTGFLVYNFFGSEYVAGAIVITLLGSNKWISHHSANIDSSVGAITGAGRVTLSGVLDRIRIITNNATDLFDAGQINVLYE